MPPDRFRVLCTKRAEHRPQKSHEAARHAHILGRDAPGAVDDGRDFRPCLSLPNLLDDHVVHPVIPKIVEMPVGPAHDNPDHIVHACHGGPRQRSAFWPQNAQ